MAMHALSNRPIQVLPGDLANKIAAGEVIERPASVVKELVENSIDAGATQIEVEVRDGGKEYIRVTDNGHGIPRAEMPIAFLRHATSKISSVAELTSVLSLGFRGEALPSIASCAELEMTSCQPGAEAARLLIKGGVAEPVSSAAGAPGTTVVVRRLFFNTPARYKFLKQGPTEKRYIAEYVTNMALAHPEVAFRLLGDNSVMLSTPGNSDLLAAISAVHGVAVARRMIPVQWESPFVQVSGFVSPPTEYRPTRAQETVFVNGRWVQNRLVYAAVEKAYDNMLGHRQYPVAVLHLTIEPEQLDVNVHPAKTEVRFRNEGDIFKHVMLAVKSALSGANLIPRIADSPEQAKGPVSIQRTLPGWAPAPATLGIHATPPAVGDYPPAVAESAPGFPYSNAGHAFHQPPSVALQGFAAAAEERPATSIAPSDGLLTDLTDADSPELLTHLRAPLAPAEPPAEAESVREYLRQAPVLGQVLDTYLVVAVPFGLWLIDQHVAHERVLYEQVLARPTSVSVQMLLVPVTLDLTPAEAALAEDARAELGEMGFILEPFGGTTFLVRAMPIHMQTPPSNAALRNLLVEIVTAWESSGPTKKERAAAMIACKAAIKAGHRLDPAAQKALLQALSNVQNPFACPHGRPILIGLDRMELERRFGRR